MISQELSHYRIIRKLGAGGMGEVFLAEDTRLARQVAIKVLFKEDDVAEDRIARFLREARAISALNHPNVCTVYELGETSDGSHYIVMEYIEGQTLEAKVKGRALAYAEALDIAVQIADALAEAHARGIIHRDIKTANLMVNERGQVKVLDFGLAKIALEHFNSANSDIATMKQTTPGMMMGTVLYMSPEQAMGKPVDHQTDLFSLGVVIYEMVTGTLPFAGETISETIVKIASSSPPPISGFNRQVPPQLEQIIRRCLEKDKPRRYQHARELLADLQNLKRHSDAGLPLPQVLHAAPLASAEPSRQSSWKPARRLTLALLLVIALCAGIYWFLKSGLAGRDGRVQSLVVLPLVNASSDVNAEYLSDGITENLINRLSQLSGLKVIARTTAFRYKGRDADVQAVGNELKVDAVMAGRVVRENDQLTVQTELINVADGTQIWGQKYRRKANDLIAVEEEIAREISEKLNLTLRREEPRQAAAREAQNGEAYELLLKGRFHFLKWTPEGRKRAIEFFNAAVDKDPTFAAGYAWLSGAYDQLGVQGEMPYQEAETKAKAYATKALALDDQLAEAHAALGITRWRDWQWREAESELRRAVDLNPSWSDGLDIFASFLHMTGDLQEARALLERAQELDPLSLNINTTLANNMYLSRDYKAAAAQYRKTLDIYANDLEALHNLAWTYAQMADQAAALKAAQAADAIRESQLVPLISAYLAAMSGRADEAKRALDTLLSLPQQGRVAAYEMAVLYAAAGENDNAFAYLEKSLAGREAKLAKLKTDVRFDRLRNDAHFTSLLSRIGLA